VIEYGARVHRLLVADSTGRERNVVLGHATLEEYVGSEAFFGATVGRYANRIAGGRFELGGETFQVAQNENGNTLHGGSDGFDRRAWTTTELTDTSATFALTSPHGDQGFPGTVRATVTYTVREEAVTIAHEAVTDRPTVVSLTNHAYFNLDGEGSGSVDGHVLSVAADRFTPSDAALLPTGGLEAVEGTVLDLRRGRRVGDVVRTGDPLLLPAKGLDHNFEVSGTGLREAASLRSPASRLTLRVESDRPGIQAYTGNFLDGTVVGTSGRVYRQGDGIALESQAFPDSPNHPEFPSTVLLPGQTYRSTTVWRFATDS
jgi:aldose 1-epimerase